MKRWALVSGGAVVSVVEQENAPATAGLWIECTAQSVGPGNTWDGQNFGPVPAKSYKLMTTAAFWARFTNNELVGYDVGMQHDPAASPNDKKAAAKLRLFRRDTSDAGVVKPASNKVVALVADLEAAGIIAAGRATQITGTPIAAEEAAD